jgi:3-phosphoshikimate 1-carboxyvinyltransferase
MDRYLVKKLTKPLDICVTVPGSKSVTNRALLMAALSDGKCVLDGVLFSDDSRHFMDSLISLGFDVTYSEEKCQAVVVGTSGDIPVKNGGIDVGSAGTAARFLTAMLAMSDGEYVINASQQMQKRPMKPLFEALSSMGADFTYLNADGCLPVKVRGNRSPRAAVKLDISESTQFLSALLMTSPMLENGLKIDITSEKTDGAYVRITRQMMEDFGCTASYDGRAYYVPAGQYRAGEYRIEPDVSAACYFYAMAAVSGGSALVRHVHYGLMQGDMKFLAVLEKMGCTVRDEEEGIRVTGPANGLNGIDVDMNDFSDQAMTLAAIAPFAKTETTIRNIAHIRLQESDRLSAIAQNLTALGIKCDERQDSITIYPGECKSCEINTYDDHRMAMAFSISGIMTDGVTILNPQCCKKTFEGYFEILDTI